MKLIIVLSVFCFYSLFLVAQNTDVNLTIKELKHKIEQSNNEDRINWLERLSLIEIDSKNVHADSTIALAYLYLGDFYFGTNDYLNSIASVEKALLIFEKLKLQKEISHCQTELGANYRAISDYEKSLFYHLNALKITEQLEDNWEFADKLGDVGNIYLLTGDLDLALAYFLKSLETSRQNNYDIGIVRSLNDIGAFYQKKHEYSKAIPYYKEALPSAQKLKLKHQEAIILGNIGSASRSLKQYDDALEYLFKALKIKEDIQQYNSAAHSCFDISETYLEMDLPEKAKVYALKTLKYANKGSYTERNGYYFLSRSNYEMGDFKQSYENLTTYNGIKDSLISVEKTARINEMQIKYETEKRENKIKNQERNIGLLNDRDKLKNLWILLGAGGLISIFGFTIHMRYLSTTKEKQRLQETFSQNLIKAQEDERARVARELHDSVGQKLMLLSKKAKSFKNIDVNSLADTTLDELRSISRGLHPPIIDGLGITAAIESLINEVDKHTNIFFTNDIQNIDKLIKADDRLHLYRIIQEVLSNIIKHANAKTVFITIDNNHTHINTIITDNGKGFEFSNNSKIMNSLGMKTLSERAKIIKSKLSIVSAPNKGTTIQLTIPMNA